MKIYFAYRSNYLPNTRFIKEFEADSILDFFQRNWQQLSDGESYADFLGVNVYGFPISHFTNETDENTSMPPVPSSFEELAKKLAKGYVYCNEVLGNEHLLEVHTDDDEIELAWYVFDETYKNKNWDKLAIWFTPHLPSIVNEIVDTTFLPEGLTQDNLRWLNNRNPPYIKYTSKFGCKFSWLKISNENDKNCYLMSSAIYDGGNLDDMQFVQLHGTDLEHLIENLKNLDFNLVKENDYLPSPIDELHTFKVLANQFDLNSLSTVIHKLNEYPRLIESGFLEHTDLQNMTVSQETGSSLISINNHIAEISIFDGHCFNYYILFDEIWATTYPELAKSIQNFGTNWKIVGTGEREINSY